MNTQLAPTEARKKSLVVDMATAQGLDPVKYLDMVKTLCGCPEATDEHFAGLLSVAHEHGLNPVLKQLYLMATKKGVQVVIPIDGHLRLMHKNPEYVTHSIEYGDDETAGPWCEVTIATKKQRAAEMPPASHREYLRECARDTGPWNSHPRRMLKHKAMSQAVRYVLGVYVADDDEWERARDADKPRRVSADVASAPSSLAEAGDAFVASMTETVVDVVETVEEEAALPTESADELSDEESARLDRELADEDGGRF